MLLCRLPVLLGDLTPVLSVIALNLSLLRGRSRNGIVRHVESFLLTASVEESAVRRASFHRGIAYQIRGIRSVGVRIIDVGALTFARIGGEVGSPARGDQNESILTRSTSSRGVRSEPLTRWVTARNVNTEALTQYAAAVVSAVQLATDLGPLSLDCGCSDPAPFDVVS